ncbi:MAG: DUF6062 family protein [Oscillospiraceae bacterium]|nr:DUF6062 family protein [Oscillospiraceae bacterium]
MRESLLTIPISEVFEPKEGCPLCRMRETVEKHICEYIMGAAMMEPDVRIETNRLGFCLRHFNLLLLEDNRLSLALMLDSYLQVNDSVFSNKKPKQKSGLFSKGETPTLTESCFVCSKIEWGINHMCKTLFTLFKKEPEFKALFLEQEFFCLPHYHYLLQKGESVFNKNDFPEFAAALNKVSGNYHKSLSSDVHEFCQSFDYRNAGRLHKEGMEQVQNSVKRAIRFLTGYDAVDN